MDTIQRLTEISDFFRESIKSNPKIDKGQMMKDVLAIEEGIKAVKKIEQIKNMLEMADNDTLDHILEIVNE